MEAGAWIVVLEIVGGAGSWEVVGDGVVGGVGSWEVVGAVPGVGGCVVGGGDAPLYSSIGVKGKRTLQVGDDRMLEKDSSSCDA